MSEYIIEWSGIGAEIVEKTKTEQPFLIVKRLRHRRKERIVRCRDCQWSRIADGSSWPANKHKQYIGKTYCIKWGDGYAGEWVKPDGYCAWGERRDSE